MVSGAGNPPAAGATVRTRSPPPPGGSVPGQPRVGVPVLAAVAALSAAALGHEILLTRLLSIVQWHHFAFLVISVALLGFGASGTFLLLAGSRIRTAIEPFVALTALGFALAAPMSFVIAERVPFNVLDAPWSPGALGWLLVIELVLAVPFFFAATGIGRALVVFRHRLSRVYAADLAGAGVGAAASVGVLHLVPAERALDFVCGLGALAGALAVCRVRDRHRPPLLLLCGVVVVLAGFGVTGELRISPFKPLPQALRVTGAELVETRSGPLGMVSAVENRVVPFRSAPGLSLMARAPVPEQAALFIDAGSPLAIVRHGGSSPPPSYLEDLTSAMPYRLVEKPRVLVLGAGGGAAVLQALGAGARSVDAVELQPHVVDLVRGRYRDFAGGIYEHPKVSVHVADPRTFVEACGEEYDLVQIIALGSGTAGLHALEAQRLLTVESVRAVLTRLSAGGVAAFYRPGAASSARRGPPSRYGAERAGGRIDSVCGRSHRLDQNLEHHDAGGRSVAAVRRPGRRRACVRRHAGVRPDPRPRHGTRRGKPLQRSRSPALPRSGAPPAGYAAHRVRARLQVRHPPRHRRPALLLELLPVAARSRRSSVSAARAGSGCSTSDTSHCPLRWSRRSWRAPR